MAVEVISFDPLLRLYEQNADLTMKASTKTIHRAAHLLLPLGSIPAVKDSGLDIVAIKKALPETRQRVVEDAVNRAWKSLLDEKVIKIHAIVLHESIPWSGLFYIDAEDLETTQPFRLQASANP